MAFKGVVIDLDHERTLLFTPRDAQAIEALPEGGGIEQMVKILHMGLRRDDPALTEEQVWDLVDLSQMEYVNGKIAEALGRKPEGVKEDVTVPLATSAPTSQA